jgi:hypothetical protein
MELERRPPPMTSFSNQVNRQPSLSEFESPVFDIIDFQTVSNNNINIPPNTATNNNINNNNKKNADDIFETTF